MQEGEDETLTGVNELSEARESEQDVSESDSGHPEKVYDFVHQHFGVALKSGGPESRAAEASGRNAVADKPKSDSWHALKGLIRYQNSTTPSASERKSYGDDGSFGAQWNLSSAVLDDMDDLLDDVPSTEADRSVIAEPSSIELEPESVGLAQTHDVVLESESAILESAPDDDTEVVIHAAEARSKFGTMNAFQKMKSRTQPAESKEKQATTGDMPETVQAPDDGESPVIHAESILAEPPANPDDSHENWEILEPASTDGATIMNQWCSSSTGDSIPSLAELDSIPTPSVLKTPAPTGDKKSFSIKTPGVHLEQEVDPPPPDAVHSAARASWLQAASEYSASVIKAVTGQMKSINSKPRKVSPESPEYQSSEPPEQSDDISST